jgi:hypothetical protein
MYYKVKKESDTHSKLLDLFERCRVANLAAVEIGKRYGASVIFRSVLNAAGGISAFMLPLKPGLWKQVFPGCYFPKNTVSNYAKIAEIKGLPVVLNSEIVAIIQNGNEMQIPGVALRNGTFYIEAPDTINPDLTQITYQEYLHGMRSPQPASTP